MAWLSTTMVACAATMIGSSAFACTNGNGGDLFTGASVNLCFPYPVVVHSVLPGMNDPLFFSAVESDHNTIIFGWLTKRTDQNDYELSPQERTALAGLFQQEVSALTFVTPSGDEPPTRDATAIQRAEWPALGGYHGANCVIYLKDSDRLLYCGAVFDSQPLEGSYDLFVHLAEAVEFS